MSDQAWDDATTADGSEITPSSANLTESLPIPRPAQSGRTEVQNRSSITSKLKGLMILPPQRARLSSELCAACEYRNIVKVRSLLEQRAPLNTLADGAKLPLHCAVKTGHFSIIKLLLENGADANKEDSANDAPLTLAVDGDHDLIADLLIKFGADVNKRFKNRSFFDRILNVAVAKGSAKMVRLLIQNGADVTAECSIHRDTILSQAVVCENGEMAEVVEILLQAGADCQIDTPSSLKGETPLMAAVRQRNVALSRLLLQYGAHTNLWDNYSAPREFCNVAKERHELALLLLEHGVNITFTKEYASETGAADPGTLKLLVEAGLEIKISPAELLELANDSIATARALLQSCRHLRLPENDDLDKESPFLMKAIQDDNVELVELVLDFGGKASGVQKAGFTPLCYTLWLHGENAKTIVDKLLLRGADVNETSSNVLISHPLWLWIDREFTSERESPPEKSRHPTMGDSVFGYRARGVTPIHFAAGCKCCSELASKLVAQGADVKVTFSFEQSETDKTRQLKARDRIAPAITDLSTLHLAIQEGDIPLLVKLGANVDAKDGLGHTPLAWAMMYGKYNELEELLQAGASVENVAHRGMNALELFYELLYHRRHGHLTHLGVEFGHYASGTVHWLLLNCLLRAGADPAMTSLSVYGQGPGTTIQAQLKLDAKKDFDDDEYEESIQKLADMVNKPCEEGRVARRQRYLEQHRANYAR